MRHLEATLTDGSTVIGEFSRLVNAQRYVAQVFSGAKPFNAWRVVGEVLPSGEKALTRTREMVAGRQILSIREVTEDGAGVPEVARGPRGRFTAPEGIDGVEAGTVFPKHRDDYTLRDYIVLKVDEAGVETRYFTTTGVTEVVDPTNRILSDGGDDDDGDDTAGQDEEDDGF